MDEKKIELFSRAWLFLGKKTCEKFGACADSMKVVLVGKGDSGEERT